MALVEKEMRSLESACDGSRLNLGVARELRALRELAQQRGGSDSSGLCVVTKKEFYTAFASQDRVSLLKWVFLSGLSKEGRSVGAPPTVTMNPPTF